MGPFPYQISVIFLWLTRLSTSQRYELIKGVFHTATTRTSVLITSVPNMQSQGGQGKDCYIWWFVFFFFALGTDKEFGIWAGKAHLCRHDMSCCWGRPWFVPLCLNVNKMLCWMVTEINTRRCNADKMQHKKYWKLDNAFKTEWKLKTMFVWILLSVSKSNKKYHGEGKKSEENICSVIFVFTCYTSYFSI